MTQYEKPSFTVPASAGNAAYCAEHGHTMPDVRGKCVRCGAKQGADDYVRTLLETTDHVAVIPSGTPCS